MLKEARYYIAAMDCPTEEGMIRNRLKRFPEIEQLNFDLMARVLTVHHTLPSDQPIAAAIAGIGMQPRSLPVGAAADGAESPDTGQPDSAAPESAWTARFSWLLITLAGIAALAAEVLHWGQGHKQELLVIGLSLLAMLLGGRETFRKGWVALRTFTLNINFLMTLAIVGAIAVEQWPEAAMVTVLFGLAEKIEGYSLDRARRAIRSLTQLAPETAEMADARTDSGGGAWREALLEQVPVGARVRVRPSERIPLDGIVESGQSAVNQAPITGESMPLEKTAGDRLFAGTINGRGVLIFTVTAGKGDTTLDRIARAVQEAQAQRAPTQRFVDQFALYYTPIVVGLAVLTAVLPPLFFDGSWSQWLYKALVLLVIACPCALVISTPVTVVSGLAAAARAGILIKGGVHLENGRRLKVIALDKTGTLTQGQPKVTDIVPLNGESPTELLHVAASLNAASEHPVAAAIVQHCAAGHECDPNPVMEFEALVGRGVTGKLSGRRYYIGNHRLTEENNVCGAHVEDVLERLEADGKTPVVLTSDEQALAVLGVADTLRENSRTAIENLRRLGLETVLLTGDTERAAGAIAAAVGISTVQANLLPEEKLAAVERLRAAWGDMAVGMVGDGINDAPALARASIGFAMGAAGTDTAIETADVALMNDDLGKIAQFVRLSRQVAAVLTQNIALAIGIKLVFFALALLGRSTLWMAVFADLGVSLLVVLNGLRLTRALPGSAAR